MLYLDPRHHRLRLDDLLRAELAPGLPLGRGAVLAERAWGLPGALRLTVCAEGEYQEVSDGVWRPSHATLHAYDPSVGLQLTQDAFATDGGSLVCVLSLRNASPAALEIQVAARWSDSAPTVRREPGPEELAQSLPEAGRAQLAFVAGEVEANVESWTRERSPVRRQSDDLDDWLAERAPRFDCADPSRLERFARRWHAAWLAGGSDAADDGIAELLGARIEGNVLALSPRCENLEHFCVADWPVGSGDARITVVWDDPSIPGDAYDDGLKGLAVFRDGKLLHRAADASPMTLTL